MDLLEVEKLTLRFGGLTAVNAVNIKVRSGEIFSVIGPNGAGKTSLFNAITGIYQPTSGSIKLFGKVVDLPVRAQTIATCVCIGLVVGTILVFTSNIEQLWDVAITANYVYQEPFPWLKALADLLRGLFDMPWSRTVFPFVLGNIIGAAGSAVVWKRARRGPDVVARAGVARTFQNIRLLQGMSVIENIFVGMDSRLKTGFWGSLFRTRKFRSEEQQARDQAMELLRFVSLDREADYCASSLSYGHQRRLEIARALASRPKLLLLDEPAAGMNPTEAEALMLLIQDIRKTGVTVLLIEHHMKVVMGISDRIAVLEYGNKIAEGTPQEIGSNPDVIRAYLG